jgi:hypothetical protein
MRLHGTWMPLLAICSGLSTHFCILEVRSGLQGSKGFVSGIRHPLGDSHDWSLSPSALTIGILFGTLLIGEGMLPGIVAVELAGLA